MIRYNYAISAYTVYKTTIVIITNRIAITYELCSSQNDKYRS